MTAGTGGEGVRDDRVSKGDPQAEGSHRRAVVALSARAGKTKSGG